MRVIGNLAQLTHGVVAWRQLRALGISSSAIDRLTKNGYLHPIHRGVYHVGHPAPTRLGLHHAATLAFGKRTAVSHRPATVLGGLLPDRGDRIEVTTASGDSGLHHGVVLVHESRRLQSADVVRFHGIPTVRLEWALVDVAGATPDQFPELFNALDRKRLVDPLLLAGQLRRGRTGSALVRARLETWTAKPPTESELEELLEGLVRDADLPLPTRQAHPLPSRPMRVDFTWPEQRVAVEVDGREWHATQDAWAEDHERDLALRMAGWTPLRYTHRQLTQTPQLVLADLAKALGSPA